ncbi:predicted protein [Plenodomus lingam JN3]|uniref:Predicted protein n=1 Tax=Leptosphaeria maculans (strain JN3 / isolate v23.1.3 / race Av1-4-5-6-7-8) TaxID=985895 RepID=E4ZQ62_LEPMJ|nr:predicted protein [Plenodomus lingam JN3]CBX89972.1 predicted protein [Plenodomus lingam JN3]
MDYGIYALSPYWNYNGFPYCHEPPVQHAPVSPLEIRKLYAEQDLLENNLADCITYVQVLRKKQARNQRRLTIIPFATRKKRNQIQQTNRDLNREILVREQEQCTLLSNLQACKAKLYIAETLSPPSTGLLSSVPAFTSGSTRCTLPEESGPESTEISWNGWTDDAVMSPFAKHSNHPFSVAEIAPEECSNKNMLELVSNGIGPLAPLTTTFEGLSITVPAASTKTDSPQTIHSFLSPKAEVFEPRTISSISRHEHVEKRADQASICKVLALGHLEDAPIWQATDSETGSEYERKRDIYSEENEQSQCNWVIGWGSLPERRCCDEWVRQMSTLQILDPLAEFDATMSLYFNT